MARFGRAFPVPHRQQRAPAFAKSALVLNAAGALTLHGAAQQAGTLDLNAAAVLTLAGAARQAGALALNAAGALTLKGLQVIQGKLALNASAALVLNYAIRQPVQGSLSLNAGAVLGMASQRMKVVLLVSITSSAGTDSYGYPYPAGVTAYIYSGGQQLAASLSTPISTSPALSFENMDAAGVLPPAVYGNAQSGSGVFNQIVLSSGRSSPGSPGSSVVCQDSGSVEINGTVPSLTVTSLTAPSATVSELSMTNGTINIPQGYINLNMGIPANYPLQHISTTPTAAEFNAVVDCLNQLIGEMVNRELIA